jgi:dihydroneopterin aldolase
MTQMLASVADAEEAAIVVSGGADIVDLKDPRRGAIGAVDLETARACVAAIGGAARISATLGDPPYEAQTLLDHARARAALGVETLKLAVDAAALETLRAPLAALTREVKLVGMMFADEGPDFDLIPQMAQLGFAGAMLDTRQKGAGRLLSYLDVSKLDAFAERCRHAGLASGLAGSLEPPDIPRLLLVAPDVLGFRGALCRDRDRVARIDAQAVALVRDLIPRERIAASVAANIDWRLLGRGLVADVEAEEDLDRIFVRDFVIQAEIGAYDFERGKRQRVAFDVEALIRRAGAEPKDMRAIFSYDVIMDAIRLVAAQGHHEFVEGLAEAVAAAVLRHERARVVKIVARKLDVIDGAVGVEIVRRRAAAQTGAVLLPGAGRWSG